MPAPTAGCVNLEVEEEVPLTDVEDDKGGSRTGETVTCPVVVAEEPSLGEIEVVRSGERGTPLSSRVDTGGGT